jgi:hypothetical protein
VNLLVEHFDVGEWSLFVQQEVEDASK